MVYFPWKHNRVTSVLDVLERQHYTEESSVLNGLKLGDVISGKPWTSAETTCDYPCLPVTTRDYLRLPVTTRDYVRLLRLPETTRDCLRLPATTLMRAFIKPQKNFKKIKEEQYRIAPNPYRCTMGHGATPPTKAIRVHSRPGHSGFSHVGIVPDDAVGLRVFSGISRFPRPFIPALHSYSPQSPSSALKTSMLRVILNSDRNLIYSEFVSEEIWTALDSEVLRADEGAIEVKMERRRNEETGETGDPRETCRPTASCGMIPTCESPVTRPGIEPRFALVGGERANRSATAAPKLK
ncbi:hypothetical protein PR048_019768 [Dryococelus australis]|uniref:Uncharacterized protein n=1 Tax=Dryococelus australis TaxID=614101 RepID=A0ABQ9H4H7_9NEOP|nr:hypothetical protein PR048_019768 [Dryococelus australis]